MPFTIRSKHFTIHHTLCNSIWRSPLCSLLRVPLINFVFTPKRDQPDSERENKYLQGGATPSSRQTLQYLLRNDVIDNVEALAAEIAYLIREREESEAEGLGSPYDSDEKDLRMYLDKCKSGFDRYLGMVLQNEIDEATEYAKMALARTKSKWAQQRAYSQWNKVDIE